MMDGDVPVEPRKALRHAPIIDGHGREERRLVLAPDPTSIYGDLLPPHSPRATV